MNRHTTAMRAQLMATLGGTLILGLLGGAPACSDAPSCSTNADCDPGFACLQTGGVLFGGQACIAGPVQSNEDAGDAGGAGDTSEGDAAPCVPESDEDFCSRLVTNCDVVEAEDSCGAVRSVHCGECTAPATCGGGGTPNSCACDAETDVDFCARNESRCGATSAIDICGLARTVDCGGCGPNSACSDQTCGCLPGFELDPLNGCIDVDECANGVDDCSPVTECTNDVGSFSCTPCPSGYDDVNSDGKTCVDVDECADGLDNCSGLSNCVNEPGGFVCSNCPPGFDDVNADGTVCLDIDECARMPPPCDPLAGCANSMGSYTCGVCPAGYDDVNGDASQCNDIDECANGTAGCAANAICTNTAGSFSCACAEDYRGDGFNCEPEVVIAVYHATIVIPSGSDLVQLPVPPFVTEVDSVVPFVTKRAYDATSLPEDFMVSVEPNGTEFGFRRDGNQGEVRLEASFVEFNPAWVRVQARDFSTAGNSNSRAISQVVEAASFLVHYLRSDAGDEKRDHTVGAFFESSSRVRVERDGGNGRIDGYVWVVEALSGQWSVQHETIPDVFGTSMTHAVAPVDMDKTLLLHSHRATNLNNDSSAGYATCRLTSPSEVACERREAMDNLSNVRLQLITFNGPELVQRGQEVLVEPDTVRTVTLPTPVTLARSMAFGGPLGPTSQCTSNNTRGSSESGVFVSQRLTGGGTAVELERGTPSTTPTTSDGQPWAVAPAWQVVQWW